MHLGAGVEAAKRNFGVTGKECQSWVIKFKQKIWPESLASNELRMCQGMSEIFPRQVMGLQVGIQHLGLITYALGDRWL